MPESASPSTSISGVGRHAVEVNQVSRRFGSVLAVDSVSLDVAHGEFVCLLGPSGCGKTTLLRLIGGFETVDAGRISLLGEDVTKLPAHRRRTNMVFQHLALFPHMNVYDNIAFGLRMHRCTEPDVARKVKAALELVRLAGHGTRRIDQLSGGQRQRIAIARAVVNEPAVLLLDEPLGSLDLRLRIEVQEELRSLQRSLGSPFIFVTHDQGEAMALADRIVVMKDGRIEQCGTPAEIYKKPQTLFVANFVGNSNVIGGTLESAGDGCVVVQALGRRFACATPQALKAGDRVAIVVRHEALELQRADGAGSVGVITDSAFLGATMRHWIRLSDGTMMQAEGPVTAAWVDLARGDAVSVSWAADAATAFAPS
jgi:spermidine/putrescine transport system ATP-binding protein